ncbi:MAG TPA: hypothetical protein DGG94_09320 [Micromonosporaceae bacterium]|nr:hypothetical protein [Micromonosporaceae bacterium]
MTRSLKITHPAADVAGVYTRISDDRESEEAGVTRQDEDGKALCATNKLRVHRVYPDNDISASTRSIKPRDSYDQLLADAAAGLIGVIVAYSSSRLTRRPLELEQQIRLAEKHGTRFLYVRSPSFDLNTADGRQIARMLAAADAAEAERTGERVSRAALQRAQQGKNHGGRRRYGFEADGVTVSESEADILRAVATRLLADDPEDARSLRQAASDLNARGVQTVTGTRWTGSTLRDVLLKPRVAGFTVHNGEEVGRLPGKPILEEDVWRALVTKLADPKRQTAGRAPRWLGSGVYRCVCGAYLDAGPREAYRCRTLRYGPGGGGHVRRKAATLDAFVIDKVVWRLERPNAVDLLAPKTPMVDAPTLRQQAADLRAQLDGWDTDRTEGRISRDRWLAQTERIGAKLTAVQATLSSAVQTSPLSALVGTDDVYAAWVGLPLGSQRAIVDLLMKVRVLPAGRGRGFDPDAIEVTWKTD